MEELLDELFAIADGKAPGRAVIVHDAYNNETTKLVRLVSILETGEGDDLNVYPVAELITKPSKYSFSKLNNVRTYDKESGKE